MNNVVKLESLQPDQMRVIYFIYTNYKGVTRTRAAVPEKIEYKATPHHCEEQWIMTAYDIDKEAYRDFALQDCCFT